MDASPVFQDRERGNPIGRGLRRWSQGQAAWVTLETARRRRIYDKVASVDPRLQLVTLGVRDVAAARRFYVDGLGWPSTFDVPGDISFIQVGPGLMLGLFDIESLAGDVGRPVGSAASAPFTLAQIVATEDDVRAALEAAVAHGGAIVKAAQHADFGGYHGYFADPDGFLWEVATNSGWSEAPDGKVTLGPIGD